jgi:hypothetical protein
MAPDDSRPDPRHSYALSRWLFLRGLALCYLFAFWSLDSQLDGLIGSHGILPAADYLRLLQQHFGRPVWDLLPTLAWLNSSDACLHALARSGMALACLGLLGLGPKALYVCLWALYLSLAGVGQDFLGFQWDYLLLETGLLAVLLAPSRLWDSPTRPTAPSALQRALFLWLLFRLMLRSGLVKWFSGDPTWHRLSALCFHYQTQPLPTFLGFYAHQLPLGVQEACCFLMFVIELVLPLFIVLGRRGRLTALAGFVTLQAFIALTGNYGFFNLLTLLLCLWLADDALYPRRWTLALPPPMPSRDALPWRWAQAFWALVALLIGTQQLLSTVVRTPTPAVLNRLAEAIDPLRSLNPYGLFAVMTTERRELILQGSDDGQDWRSYGMKWKPGDPQRRPAFIGPHMPHLDWQLWFAALGERSQSPWTLNWMARVLQGEPSVLALMGEDPFAGRAPKYLRVQIWDYRFNTLEGKAASGDWWLREPLGQWCPPLSLK